MVRQLLPATIDKSREASPIMNQQIPPFLIWLWIAAGLIGLVFLLAMYVKRRSRCPRISPDDVLYQESFASGHSTKNLLTKLGGANNCLRLVVTKDCLWITSWFPFSLFTTFYDLEHVVPRSSLRAVEPTSVFWKKGVRITFLDEASEVHTVVAVLRDVEGFLAALDFDSRQGR